MLFRKDFHLPSHFVVPVRDGDVQGVVTVHLWISPATPLMESGHKGLTLRRDHKVHCDRLSSIVLPGLTMEELVLTVVVPPATAACVPE